MTASACSTIDVSDLEFVSGGAGEGQAARVGAAAAARVGARAASRAIPVIGQVAMAADAGYSAYQDYNKARANGDGVMSSMGSGALGALNSVTFGASNWLLGR